MTVTTQGTVPYPPERRRRPDRRTGLRAQPTRPRTRPDVRPTPPNGHHHHHHLDRHRRRRLHPPTHRPQPHRLPSRPTHQPMRPRAPSVLHRHRHHPNRLQHRGGRRTSRPRRAALDRRPGRRHHRRNRRRHRPPSRPQWLRVGPTTWISVPATTTRSSPRWRPRTACPTAGAGHDRAGVHVRPRARSGAGAVGPLTL